MYTLTFFGNKYRVSPLVWFSVMTPLFLIGLYLFGCIFVGMYKLGGWFAVITSILLVVELHVNNKKYALIPFKEIRSFLGMVVVLVGIGYYFIG